MEKLLIYVDRKTGEFVVMPTNFGAAYKVLFEQTRTNGYRHFESYSSNNFKNAFERADQALFDEFGSWAEIYRNIIRGGPGGTDNKGRTNMIFINDAKTGQEKEHNLQMPPAGFIVPIDKFNGNNAAEILFQDKTLVPHHTVKSREYAAKICRAKDFPIKYLSALWRIDNYKEDEESFVCRCFYPATGNGRFGVGANGLPSGSDRAWFASRPVVEIRDLKTGKPFDKKRL